MKGRFSTIDLSVVVAELQSRALNLRVQNVYDIDNKTYLIKMSDSDQKCVLLLESGIRLHATEFDWPKHTLPSGFSMKLRKHLKNRRLAAARQLGCDRIVDLTFGYGEAAYHVIMELFDRGNLFLTDFEFTILALLRPRSDVDQDVRFAVRETYPIQLARERVYPTPEMINEIFSAAKSGDAIKKLLVAPLTYGPAILEDALVHVGLKVGAKIGKDVQWPADAGKIGLFLERCEELFSRVIAGPSEAVILYTSRPGFEVGEEVRQFTEFHPWLFSHHVDLPHVKCASFNHAVDEFFSSTEQQKTDVKAAEATANVMKKLDKVKANHETRLITLERESTASAEKANLLEMNVTLVEKALAVIRGSLAAQMQWAEIEAMVKEAQSLGDPVAKSIIALKLEKNMFTMKLEDPYEADVDAKPDTIELDLALSAYQNVKRYHDSRRQSSNKHQRTTDAAKKALKSAESKTKQTLKDVKKSVEISRQRKPLWFEKFLWFITSDGLLVLSGRDQHQNELLVKRHLRAGDLYVHGDLHGAASVVLKNPVGGEVPPQSIIEAGVAAVAYSAAWESHALASAWWVYNHQVSKTAPTGEYLSAGSFIIRGKKNFLTQTPTVYGLGVLFRLADDSVAGHAGEWVKARHDVDNLEETKEVDSEGPETIEEDLSDKLSNLSLNEPAVSAELEFPETDVKYSGLATTTIISMRTRQKQGSKKRPTSAPVPLPAHVRAASPPPVRKSAQTLRKQEKKAKKAREKYKWQDEDERIERMKLMGHKMEREEVVPVVEEELAGGGADIESVDVEDAVPESDNTETLLSNPIEEPSSDSTVPVIREDSLPDELVGQNGDEVPGADEPEEPDEATGHEVDVINTLTARPIEDDSLLHAVLVCAPYTALINWPLKVKLVPGQTKRGAAGHTCGRLFLSMSSPQTRDLIKAVKDEEWARNLPGRVKVMAPGVNKLQNQKSKQKKVKEKIADIE